MQIHCFKKNSIWYELYFKKYLNTVGSSGVNFGRVPDSQQNCGDETAFWCLRARKLDAAKPELSACAWKVFYHYMLPVGSDPLGVNCGQIPDLQQNCGDGMAFWCLTGSVGKIAWVASQRCSNTQLDVSLTQNEQRHAELLLAGTSPSVVEGPEGTNGRRTGRRRTRIAYTWKFVPASQKSVKRSPGF